MPKQHRVAVIVIHNDPSTPSPRMADVMDLVLYSQTPIVRYLRDTTERFFTISPLHFFGPYVVPLPPPPLPRSSTIELTRAAATSNGVDLGTEGWGASWDRFQDFWYRVTHPVPIVDVDPRPDPEDPLRLQARLQLDRIRTLHEELRRTDPALAERVGDLVVEQERVLTWSALDAVARQHRGSSHQVQC